MAHRCQKFLASQGVGLILLLLGAPAVAARPNLFPAPQIPPTPAGVPVISDLAVFTGSGTLITSAFSGNGLSFSATCDLWISKPDDLVTPGSEVLAAGPPCTWPLETLTFSGLPCTGGLDSPSAGVTITSPDSNLTGFVYHMDMYAGIGLFSGTAQEATVPVVVLGVMLLIPTPDGVPSGLCNFPVDIAGAMVVEESLGS